VPGEERGARQSASGKERRCEEMSEKVGPVGTTSGPAKVNLRPREAVMAARKGEIVRAMRDAAELKQPIEIAWVEELAEIVGVDIRRR
jgi:hypothetical protein